MVKIIFSEHVLFEIERRKLDRKKIEHIIQFPDQEIPAKKDRVVRQGRQLINHQRLRNIGKEK